MVALGTRPEAVKLAPVIRELQAAPWARVRVLATAQHRELLDQILAFFELEPDIDLDLMRPGQSLADLTARMIPAVDAVLADEKPDFLVVQGDTTTVMVVGLCGFYRRIPIGHVEAGLRTGQRYDPFPEEMNRALVGRMADLHFCPTPQAAQNLRDEGIDDAVVYTTGNTVIDALRWGQQRVASEAFAPTPGRRLLLVTAHRRESFGAPFREICKGLLDIVAQRDVDVLLPVHPNPNVEAVVDELLRDQPGIRVVPPLAYAEFLAAMQAADLILTDSGGVQEEGPSLGKPVLVLRDTTERPEGVAAGTAILVGPHRQRIVETTLRLLDDPVAYQAMAQAVNPYGDGHAAQRIVAAIRDRLG